MSSQPLAPFEPVALKPRHDGWTAEKQIAFLETLAETACVEQACRRVGMTRQSAYRLRRDPRALGFRDGWDNALDHGLHQLEGAAMSRAIHGVPQPVFYKGEQVGERREYDERLTMFLLRNRRPQRYGKWIDRMLAADLDPEAGHRCPARSGDPTWRFNEYLDGIEFETPEEGFEP